MLSGFNTNFRYRGVLFHVQTEDSGLENPHVISHLFHGGNIMASEKRDYSDLIAVHSGPDLEGAIRKMMEGQHKSMLKQLSRGEHDPTIAQRMGPDVFRVDPGETAAPEPPSVTEEELPPPLIPPASAQRIASVSAPTAPSAAAPASPSMLAAAPTIPPPAASSPRTPAQVEATVLEVAAPPPAAAPVSRLSRVFGDRVVSEKPLDEVVLDYLVENARKRKRTTK